MRTLSTFLFIFCALTFSLNAAEGKKTSAQEQHQSVAPEINCAGFAPENLPACAETSPHAVNEIWETFYWGKEIDPALTKIEKVKANDLSIEEKIVAQTALFFLFNRESWNRNYAYMSPKALDEFKHIKTRIAHQVKRLALPRNVLEKLGPLPEATMSAWLGDPKAWVDRGTDQIPLMHENFLGMAMTFRPIKTKKFRAIFSQCVAIDTEWQTHITPIVAGIEAIHGRNLQEKACVAHLDASRLGCPPANRLKVEDFSHGTPKGLAQFLGDHGGPDKRCIACHRGTENNFIRDRKTAAEQKEHLEKRHEAFLDQSQRMASYIKEWAEGD